MFIRFQLQLMQFKSTNRIYLNKLDAFCLNQKLINTIVLNKEALTLVSMKFCNYINEIVRNRKYAFYLWFANQMEHLLS